MTREEAIKIFQVMKKIMSIPNSNAARTIEAIEMAIESLQAVPKLIKVEYSPFSIEETSTPSQTSFRGTQEVHYYEVQSVVRCKDCRHRDLFSCPLADNDFQKDEDFCSWGERRVE